MPNGTGQTIAIVVEYGDPNIYNDVNTFDKLFGITSSGSKLYDPKNQATWSESFLNVFDQSGNKISGNTFVGNPMPGSTLDSWIAETVMDVEWAHAIAPAANIELIECDPNASGNVPYGSPGSTSTLKLSGLLYGIYTATHLASNYAKASVVSMSFGYPPAGISSAANAQSPAQNYLQFENNLDQALFTQSGVTFVTGSGDQFVGGGLVGYPSTSPNVISVGGTVLSPTPNVAVGPNTLRGWSETAWPGTVGGTDEEVMPGYQLQFFHQLLGLRTTPDVAFLAANAAVVDSNGATQWPHLVLDGGTSLAAPCWAGLIALVNQERTSPLNAASPTEALSALYSLSPKDYNKIPPPPDFSAQNAGYNTWTGLGSPVATLLLPALVAYDSSPTIKQDPTFPPGTVGAPTTKASPPTAASAPRHSHTRLYLVPFRRA